MKLELALEAMTVPLILMLKLPLEAMSTMTPSTLKKRKQSPLEVAVSLLISMKTKEKGLLSFTPVMIKNLPTILAMMKVNSPLLKTAMSTLIPMEPKKLLLKMVTLGNKNTTMLRTNTSTTTGTMVKKSLSTQTHGA